MHIQLDPRDTVALDGQSAIFLAQLLELIVDLAGHQRAQLDLAFDLLRGAYAHEALLVLQDLDAITVFYGADAVVNRGDVVAEIGLGRGNIHDFAAAQGAAALAGGGKEQHEQERELSGQAHTERTETRIQGIQWLLFWMNLHYNAGRPKGQRFTFQ